MNNVTIGLEEIEVQLTNKRITTPVVIRLNEASVSVQVVAPDNNYIEVDFSLINNKVVMTTRNYSGDKAAPRRETLYSFDSATAQKGQ